MLGRFEELVVILVIIVVLFGGKKLPQLAKGIGESVREIRKGFHSDATDEVKTSDHTANDHSVS